MTNSCENLTIDYSLVANNKRLGFLPKQLGWWAIQFEQEVYKWSDRLCPDYNGGYWDFYALSNNGFFMSPDLDNNIAMVVDGNGFSGNLNNQTAGIILTLFALSSLAFDHHEKTDIFATKYHQLLDYADSHPEYRMIFKEID